jgi:hypothetical protein
MRVLESLAIVVALCAAGCGGGTGGGDDAAWSSPDFVEGLIMQQALRHEPSIRTRWG